MTYFRSNAQIREQRKLLKEQGEPYRLKVTNMRMYLSSYFGKTMTGKNRMNPDELIYIKQVRDHIIKNKLYLSVPKVGSKNTHFLRYGKDMELGYKTGQCYEIDLSSAYWETANNLGLLQPQVYKMASTINPDTGAPFMSKETRLAAIGTTARKSRTYIFDGKKETKRLETSRHTQKIWDIVCYKISKVMIKAMKGAGDDFLFFWVDAIFVKSKKSAQKVKQIFRKSGFKFSEIDIKEVEVLEKEKKIRVVKLKKTAKKRIRLFPFAPDKQKRLR